MAQGRSFKFRLESVRNYRHRLLDMSEQALGEANRELCSAQDRLAYLCAERAACRRAVSESGPAGRLDVDDVKDLDLRIRYLGDAIERQRDEVRRRELDVETKRLDVIEASKRKEVVERLRERDYSEFLGEMAYAERKFLDEVGSVRAARSRSGDYSSNTNARQVIR